jgi:DNA-directed RNA polymerase subunit RPC12/RpoP
MPKENRWYRKFGFFHDPLEIKPLKETYTLQGRNKEKEEILYRILSGNLLLIEGKPGSGRTALLKHAIDNFRGKGKVVYINAGELSKRLNISDYIEKKPKGMILLLDNVQSLSFKNNERIKYYYDTDQVKSAVFTTTSQEEANFSQALKDRLGSSIIKLNKLQFPYCESIIAERLGNKKHILPKNVLKELFRTSSGVKEFLIKCRMLCTHLADKGKEKAGIADARLLNDLYDEESTELAVEEEAYLCNECSENLVKVGNYWRCPSCDAYCLTCGALVDEEDTACPECGIEFEEDEEYES